MMETTLAPLALDAGTGRSLWHLGALITFKALGVETGGAFWAIEGLADSTMAVPMHIHERDDECWYILDGEITFFIGDEVTTKGAGGFAYIPRGVAHSFMVQSGTARWLGIGTPAGFDDWFFETGEPAQSLTIPEPPAPPDPVAFAESLARFGTIIVGPPPAR